MISVRPMHFATAGTNKEFTMTATKTAPVTITVKATRAPKTPKAETTVKGKGKTPATPVKAPRAASQSAEIQAALLKIMKKGKTYTSRDLVLALGRTPGQKEGGPVVNRLKAMKAAGIVKEEPLTEGLNARGGYAWKLA